MIRNFMQVMFPKLTDIMFVIGCGGALVGAISAGGIAGQFGGSGVLTFLFTLLGGLVAVVILFGVIYVLLDIRDACNRQSALNEYGQKPLAQKENHRV